MIGKYCTGFANKESHRLVNGSSGFKQRGDIKGRTSVIVYFVDMCGAVYSIPVHLNPSCVVKDYNRGTIYKQRSTEIVAWVNNHTHCIVWGVINYPCPNFNNRLTKPPLMLVHWRIFNPIISRACNNLSIPKSRFWFGYYLLVKGALANQITTCMFP